MKGLKAAVLALSAFCASADQKEIAYYMPNTDVEPHARIDLSMKALDKAVGGKVLDATYGDSTAVEAGFKVFHLAEDIYTKGGGASSPVVKYKIREAVSYSAVPRTCYHGAQGSSEIGKAKNKKAKEYKVGDSFEVYYNDALQADCGLIPRYGTGGANLLKSDGTTSTEVLSEAADYISPFAEAECPQDLGAGAVIFCADSSDGNPVTIKVESSVTNKGRTLQGFMTGGWSKFAKYNENYFQPGPDGTTSALPMMPDYKKYKDFHGGDDNAKTYNDETIMSALDALKQKDLVSGSRSEKFSTCVSDANEYIKEGATEEACSGTFEQGNAICKKTSNRQMFLPGTAADQTFDEKKQACVDEGGKVTRFFDSVRDPDGNEALQVVKKMAVYSNAWLYTIYEFEDAIADCVLGNAANNDASVHAWDEGVAFYTGSLVGSRKTGLQSGASIYTLANKRCVNYNTCKTPATDVEDSEGESLVNLNLFKAFGTGQIAAHSGLCYDAQVQLTKIISLMSVPVIQGALKYGYDMAGAASTATQAGEGYAFMMSIVHQVASCSQKDAEFIYNAMDQPALATKPSWTFDQLKKAFENNYACMGISCELVGAMKGKWEPCVDPAPKKAADKDEDDGDLPSWALIAIIACGALALIFFGLACYFKAEKDKSEQTYNNMKTKNAAGAV